jgi:Spy/CpxP family protein refolding chaperone
MKALFRVILVAAGFSVAALPAARAADEVPPAAPGGPNSAAQPDRPKRRGRHMDPAQRLQRLTEALSLTEGQQAKIKSIFQEEAGKRQAIMDDSSLSRDDQHAKRQELMKDIQTRVRAILTPEQQTKFDAMPRPGRGPRGEGPGGEPPPPPPPPPPADSNPPAGGNT